MTVDVTRDDRKSASLAARHLAPPAEARRIGTFELARDVLRNPEMVQAAVGAEQKTRAMIEPQYQPVFFLDGEAHKLRRQAIARFFTPKAISTRYRLTMEEISRRLVDRVQRDGRAVLDEISFELTVGVAAEIVGLTNSNPAAMAKRINAVLLSTRVPNWNAALRPIGNVLVAFAGLRFFVRDVRPAIRARRSQRSVDVISHLLDEGYPDKAILIECMTYAVAGMVTTREFITMAAWHMFDDDTLRRRFVAADEAEQTVILEEILRLEPVASLIYRRASGDATFPSGSIEAGELLTLSIREANLDEQTVGKCPFALDPDRATDGRIVGAYLSFGEGSHRCPGSQVAIQESRVFLDALLRVPGLRLQRRPDMAWNTGINSYELRKAVVVCG